jgi:LPXTG-motif cell wall-anchored protein
MLTILTSNRKDVRSRKARSWLTVLVTTIVAVLALPSPASAAQAPVGLGVAAGYSVLGGQAVTNTGPSTLVANLGVSPGTAITGFPPGQVGGAVHAGDAAAAQAQSDLVVAYNDAAGRAPTASVAGDLVGQTLTAGVYRSAGPLAVSGTLTLNGQGSPNSVFVFQVASTLITASASHIVVINGAQACHIYWQVGSSATLGTHSTFQGSVLALTSITVTTGTSVAGRALARNGQVTLDDNNFTSASCASTPTTSASASSAPASRTPTPTSGPTSTPTPTRSSTATAGPASSASSANVGAGAGMGSRSAVGSGAGVAPHSTVASQSMTSGGLANTGAGATTPLLAVAGLLLVMGATLVAAGRNRARRPRQH